MESSIKIVVFDLGGVMIRLADGWAGACQCAGIPYRPFAITDALQGGFAQLEELISTDAITSQEYGQRAALLLADRYSPAEICFIYQAIIREEFPGMHRLVLAVKRAGMRTACLSNTCCTHWKDLTNPALYPAICALDFHHASHLFRCAKPNPRIYELFERATNYPPKDILFFDDRQENVTSACARGWSAIRIHELRSPVEQIYAALAAHGILLPMV